MPRFDRKLITARAKTGEESKSHLEGSLPVPLGLQAYPRRSRPCRPFSSVTAQLCMTRKTRRLEQFYSSSGSSSPKEEPSCLGLEARPLHTQHTRKGFPVFSVSGHNQASPRKESDSASVSINYNTRYSYCSGPIDPQQISPSQTARSDIFPSRFCVALLCLIPG